MVLGFTALLCLGGVGVAVSLYDEATEIKRTAPDAVVDNFLRAYLVNRDDQEAARFISVRLAAISSQIQAYRADIDAQGEAVSRWESRVTWSSLDVAANGPEGTVTTELTKTIRDQSGRD